MVAGYFLEKYRICFAYFEYSDIHVDLQLGDPEEVDMEIVFN